jgi:hypothetical protein
MEKTVPTKMQNGGKILAYTLILVTCRMNKLQVERVSYLQFYAYQLLVEGNKGRKSSDLYLSVAGWQVCGKTVFRNSDHFL